MAPELEALGLGSGDTPAALTAKIDVFSLGQTFLDAILLARPCMGGFRSQPCERGAHPGHDGVRPKGAPQR